MTWVVQSVLKVWMPLIILTFTSTSMVSIGKRHLKYLCMKLHSGIRIHDIWNIIKIVIYSFCSVYFIVSCVSKAEVNHAIPCLSIMWKGSGSLLTKHLILILSLSLIVITLGKLILLSLKVTLTSFQYISRVSQI